MVWIRPKKLKKWCHHLSSETTTTCTNADTYYKIGWTWWDGEDCNCWWEYDWTGKITFTGKTQFFMFVWVSDLSADWACDITYWLYKNWVLVNNAETLHTFPASARVWNISITNIIKINTWDYFEVYVKSDIAWITVTHKTLFLSFLWDR